MFSGLIGQIFASSPVHRQAEHADTRAELQRREFDDGKNAKKDGKNSEAEPNMADDATVSVQSLSLFLTSFLATVTEKPKKSFASAVNPQEKQAARPDHQARESKSGPNAHAASAYRKTAVNAGGAAPDGPGFASNPETHIGETVSAEDIRLMHKILDDLKTLENKGIQYLHIRQGERFLQSIATAAKQALDQLDSR